MAGNGNDASVDKLPDFLGLAHVLCEVGFRRHAGKPGARLAAIFQNLRQRGSRLYLFAPEMVNFAVPCIRHHDLLLRIEHAEPLRHVVERGIEALIHRLEFGGILRKQTLTAFLLGDIFMGRDPTAVRQRFALNEYLATVGRDEALLWLRGQQLDLLIDGQIGFAAVDIVLQDAVRRRAWQHQLVR